MLNYFSHTFKCKMLNSLFCIFTTHYKRKRIKLFGVCALGCVQNFLIFCCILREC